MAVAEYMLARTVRYASIRFAGRTPSTDLNCPAKPACSESSSRALLRTANRIFPNRAHWAWTAFFNLDRNLGEVDGVADCLFKVVELFQTAAIVDLNESTDLIVKPGVFHEHAES